MAAMDPRLLAYFEQLKAAGLEPEREARLRIELASGRDHGLPESPEPAGGRGLREDGTDVRLPLLTAVLKSIYALGDLDHLQALTPAPGSYAARIGSIDELLERDRQREKDGFPRKIRVGRLIKPGKGGKDKVVVVPTTVEEKLVHDNTFREQAEEGSSGGSGSGEEGEVIGEQPVRPERGSGTGAGEGESGPHEMESSAYDLGKILTEQFELPNLKDKGKKRSLTRYSYDLTDRHRGFGQLLDKKATLRQIIETNLTLGNLRDPSNIDPSSFLVQPHDKIYRILSKEKDFESQAMIFFLRDYSGSMSGKPTELVVSQHVLIYSWILYQYAGQVESRFILHDTEAREVPDFYTYYNSKVAGGTKVASAFRLVNEIVATENLVRDYNIYVFHGTDGDDWDSEGKEAVPEIRKILTFANRVGVTVARNGYGGDKETEVEKYLKAAKLLDEHPELIRLDVLPENADEPRLIEGIKTLIS
jgi:uncharacterized sporulation protein YeaH/YhbH (DUF444 family)